MSTWINYWITVTAGLCTFIENVPDRAGCIANVESVEKMSRTNPLLQCSKPGCTNVFTKYGPKAHGYFDKLSLLNAITF